MKIIFSRHARRRARLYDISESVISDILSGIKVPQGEHEIIRRVEGLKYPLKIVVSTKGDTITVITSYPLKKGRKK